MAPQSTAIREMLSGYFLATVEAVGTLYGKRLYGHALILNHSTIDVLGLLDAPPDQVSATGASYMAWAKKYFLPQGNFAFDEVALWGSRCAVLHTFTSESKLSREGKARELQFFSGDKASEASRRFVEFARTADDGRHVAVHWQEFCDAFFAALKAFVPVLEANCTTNLAHANRLRKVLQVHPYE